MDTESFTVILASLECKDGFYYPKPALPSSNPNKEKWFIRDWCGSCARDFEIQMSGVSISVQVV